MERPVLSIYIATYNRKNILLHLVQHLLSFRSKDFNVFVLDDCSEDGTVEALREINDSRLQILVNEQRVGCNINGAMPNWFKLAEVCNGIFSFHLNDRDCIDLEGLQRLIEFLKKNQELAGGVCDLHREYTIYSPEDAFLNIPYNAIHPTGIIFNTHDFHQIVERKSFYTKEKSYIHPHDLILGKLCEMGALFCFEKIWSLADQSSFKENKSFLYKKGNIHTAWFSPTERLKEYSLFLHAIKDAPFSMNNKKQKILQISKHYLFYCTLNYRFFLNDPGQVAHYGIIPEKISFWQMNCTKREYIRKTLILQERLGFKINKIKYYIIMNNYFFMMYLGMPIWKLIKKIREK